MALISLAVSTIDPTGPFNVLFPVKDTTELILLPVNAPNYDVSMSTVSFPVMDVPRTITLTVINPLAEAAGSSSFAWS